jgi:hypothetical protein
MMTELTSSGVEETLQQELDNLEKETGMVNILKCILDIN